MSKNLISLYDKGHEFTNDELIGLIVLKDLPEFSMFDGVEFVEEISGKVSNLTFSLAHCDRDKIQSMETIVKQNGRYFMIEWDRWQVVTHEFISCKKIREVRGIDKRGSNGPKWIETYRFIDMFERGYVFTKEELYHLLNPAPFYRDGFEITGLCNSNCKFPRSDIWDVYEDHEWTVILETTGNDDKRYFALDVSVDICDYDFYEYLYNCTSISQPYEVYPVEVQKTEIEWRRNEES